MDAFQFQYRVYRRPMREPLRTAHGNWALREGIAVRLTDTSGQHGYGEMAPMEVFGTESLDELRTLCAELGPVVAPEELQGITLPCARFAIGCARAMLAGEAPALDSYPVACLLPPGQRAAEVATLRLVQGQSAFKVKVVDGSPEELEHVDALLRLLADEGGTLRVDANCSLTAEQTGHWMETLAAYEGVLEFLEQPMAVGKEVEMRLLMERHGVPVALDESVATLAALRQQMGWPGVLVVKPAISGDPLELRELLAARQGKVVVSSALETAIGAWGALLVAGATRRPIGFGVECWQTGDPCSTPVTGGYLDASALTPDYLGDVWSHIGSS